MVKVTVIATGFALSHRKEVTSQVNLSPFPQEAPPLKAQSDTPPYLFEPKGSDILWNRPAWEKQWEPYETPSFIRKNKQTPMRKTPREVS